RDGRCRRADGAGPARPGRGAHGVLGRLETRQLHGRHQGQVVHRRPAGGGWCAPHQPGHLALPLRDVRPRGCRTRGEGQGNVRVHRTLDPHAGSCRVHAGLSPRDVGAAHAAAWMYGRACAADTIHLVRGRRRPDVSGIDAAPPRLNPPLRRIHAMVTVKDLDAFFTEGWNRHDVDRLMTFMADDCVFETASGPDVFGTRHTGSARVPEAFARVFANFPDVVFADARHVVAGDRGLSEWVFTGTNRDGKRVEVQGCDVFTFRGDKIAVKSSFLKARTV